MAQPRLTGPGAGSDKYDLLTALAVAGLACGGQQQVSLLRLSALVTARYNWAQDDMAVGQREMAALWSVDERTAKREVKRLVDSGLLVVLRPGVKGRVARYRLDFAAIRALTEAHWAKVGPDFLARMSLRHAPRPVVPVGQGATPWERTCNRLRAEDPARFGAWFAGLRLAGQEGEKVTVTAPTRFAAQYVATHLRGALEAALRAEFGAGLRCEIRAGA